MKNLNSRKTGIVFSYISNILNMVCGIYLSRFLLLQLGDTDYGIYQTVASFASYLVLLEFGTGSVMTRNIASCRGRNAPKSEIDRNVSTIWTVMHILAGAIFVFSVAFYFCIDFIYSATMTPEQIAYAKMIFIFVVIYLISGFYMQTLDGIILGYEKYSFVSIQNIFKTVLRTGLLIGILLCVKTSIVIAAVDAVLNIILIAYVLFYSKKKLSANFSVKLFDKLIFRSSLPLCFALFLQSIVNQANNNVDKFVIGVMISPEAVTLYSISLYIFTVFTTLTSIPLSMYAPQVSIDMNRGVTMPELSKRLVPACRLSAIVGGTVFFGFIAAGKQFINFFYGAGKTEAWIIAIIIMAPMFINMINGVLINVLNQLNKRMVRSVALLGTTVLNIVLTVWWINVWGIIGAAVATCLCTFIGQVVIMNIYYAKYLKIRVLYMFREAFRGILRWQAAGAAIGLVVGRFFTNEILSFFVCGLIFVIVSVSGYLIFGMNKSEKEKVLSFLQRRKR